MSMLRKSSRSVLVKLFKRMAVTGQSTIQTGNELDYVLFQPA